MVTSKRPLSTSMLPMSLRACSASSTVASSSESAEGSSAVASDSEDAGAVASDDAAGVDVPQAVRPASMMAARVMEICFFIGSSLL